MSTQKNTFTPLSLSDDQAKTIGSAAVKLFKKRLRDGRINTERGSQSALGLARTLADILKIDADTNNTNAEPEAAGIEIVNHLNLRKQRETGWYNLIGGTKAVKGVALTTARLFNDPKFVDDINSNRI
tara:strand:+ start:15396 stop:15779 length:384 start_codon:yes stop_codon:yes gene_type:complete